MNIFKAPPISFRFLSSEELYGPKLVENAIRVKDPCVLFHGHWLVKRLATVCSRIELPSLPKERDEARLPYDIGWETANMHFGSPKAIAKVKRDLALRRGRWRCMHKGAKAMSKSTLEDWDSWQKHGKKTAQNVQN